MNIVRLMLKDLRLQRGFVFPLLAIQIGGLWAFLLQIPAAQIPGAAFGLLHGVLLVGDFLICYRTMVAEEKNRALLLVKMLPVSTEEIVLAKFAVNFLAVCVNTGLLFLLWEAARRLGWMEFRPALTLPLVIGGLTWHCLNNAFFLAIAWIFDSERAVWVPFPALFAVMSVILNFRRVKAALHLGPAVDFLGANPGVVVVMVWAVIFGFVGASFVVMRRKRVFA
ncbi:MAG TPA: ABC-2 transporter permease [Candidatus Acidoferrales bacterium]|nr:ABC-2 transporter permease [Candidatus Acidoferrales bacterium]